MEGMFSDSLQQEKKERLSHEEFMEENFRDFSKCRLNQHLQPIFTWIVLVEAVKILCHLKLVNKQL